MKILKRGKIENYLFKCPVCGTEFAAGGYEVKPERDPIEPTVNYWSTCPLCGVSVMAEEKYNGELQ